MQLMKHIANKRGSGVVDVIIIAGLIVFLIMPVLSVVLEKFIILPRGQIMKDAIDISNIATYNALQVPQTSKVIVVPNNVQSLAIYRRLLAKNLNLNDDLTPKADSLADGPVTIDSLLIYSGSFPVTCPNGNTLNRTTVHAEVTIPVKPSLYREILLQLMGKEYVELKVHVDSEIPVNN